VERGVKSMATKNPINLSEYDKPRRAVDTAMRMYTNDDRLKILNMFPSMSVTRKTDFTAWKEQQFIDSLTDADLEKLNDIT
tara:strand:+ start:997 stop:1239 length:243 start_codon:yes stop_codon:yes gene_type:complete